MSEPVFRRASTDDAAAIAEVTAEVVSGPNPVGIDEPLSVPHRIEELNASIGNVQAQGSLMQLSQGARYTD